MHVTKNLCKYVLKMNKYQSNGKILILALILFELDLKSCGPDELTGLSLPSISIELKRSTRHPNFILDPKDRIWHKVSAIREHSLNV